MDKIKIRHAGPQLFQMLFTLLTTVLNSTSFHSNFTGEEVLLTAPIATGVLQVSICELELKKIRDEILRMTAVEEMKVTLHFSKLVIMTFGRTIEGKHWSSISLGNNICYRFVPRKTESTYEEKHQRKNEHLY